MPSIRRLIYASRPKVGTTRGDVESIFWASTRNNGMDGLTGVLWHAEDRYVQVLEGAPVAIQDVFDRILVDKRHLDVQVLYDEDQVDREFGDWSMAGLPGELPHHASERLRGLIANKGAETIQHFLPAASELAAG